MRRPERRASGQGMDIELVVRAQHGDQAAFAGLSEAIDDRFHGVAFGILRDMELAQDAVQSALLTLWRDLPKLRDPLRFEAWSYRLLVRACYAESRRDRRWMPNLVGKITDDTPVDGGFDAIVDRDQLERGFRRLSLEQRAVIVLHHSLDMPLEQVAETLGIPMGTARSRLFRAVQGLRAALEADARAPRVLSRNQPQRGGPMTAPQDFDRSLRAWLRDVPPHTDRARGVVLAQVATTRQHHGRRWTSRQGIRAVDRPDGTVWSSWLSDQGSDEATGDGDPTAAVRRGRPPHRPGLDRCADRC